MIRLKYNNQVKEFRGSISKRDGKIFIYSIDKVIRIRTGENGIDALAEFI